MVKVTIESEDDVRIIEGECAMVFMKGPEDESGEKVQVGLLGRHEDPDELLIKIARAVGYLAREFFDNPFKRLVVAQKAAFNLVDATDDDTIKILEMDRKTERIKE